MSESHEHVSMSFGDHLEELRSRLIHAVIGIALCCVVTFWFGNDIVVLAVQPLIHVQRAAGLPAQTYFFNVATAFGVYMKVSLIAGLVLASPWVFYQLWRFVRPGLYASERKLVYLLIPFSASLTAAGVAFMYFVMLPVSLTFLVLFSTTFPEPGVPRPGVLDILVDTSMRQLGVHRAGVEEPLETAPASGAETASLMRLPRLSQDPASPPEGTIWIKVPENEVRVAIAGQIRVLTLSISSVVSPMIEIGQYISFVLLMTVGTVGGFQLPLVMMLLGSFEAFDPARIARYRPHAIVAMVTISAVVTPSGDPWTLFVFAVPMCLLFELGLMLMRMQRRQPRRDLWAEDSDADDESRE